VYDIAYDDGDSESSVPVGRIRVPRAAAYGGGGGGGGADTTTAANTHTDTSNTYTNIGTDILSVGFRVEANWRGAGTYYPGRCHMSYVIVTE
jgi:hypothetical protein